MASNALGMFLAVVVSMISAAAAESTAAHATARTAVTPVQKVLTLLGKMEKQGKAALQEEKVAYAETETWCTTETAQLEKQIADSTAAIEDLTAEIAKQSSLTAELAEDIAGLETQIADTEAELKAAAAQRKKENAHFKAAHTDISESVSAVERAVATLKSQSADIPQTSLLQISRSSFLDPSSQHLIQAFLDLKAGNSDLQMLAVPEANAYEFQSGGIVGMLEKLGIKFKGQKDALEKAEIQKRSGFDQFSQTLTDDIEAAKDTLAKKTALKAQADESLTIAKSSKGKREDSLADDKTTLSDTTANCAAKSKEFQMNQATRTEELAAIQEALEIIESDAVSGHAKSHLPAGAMIQNSSTSFAHLRKKVRARDDPKEISQHVASLLERSARKLNSRILELVAVRTKYDPMENVRNLIKQLVAKLKAEANQEADKHVVCSHGIHSNTLTRKQKTKEIEEYQSRLDYSMAQMRELDDEIAELQKDIVAITEAQSEALAIRNKDKKRNLATIKDAKEAQEAVSNAISALKDFYEPTGSSAALLQGTAADVTAEMAKVTASAPYTGMSGQGSGVLGMLDVVLSDFARLESETQSDEDSDAEAHSKYDEEANDNIALKKAQIEHLQNKNQDEIERRIHFLTDQMNQTKLELEAAEKVYEGLKTDCIDTGLSYEERVEKREEEIRSLKEALEVLTTEELTEIDTSTEAATGTRSGTVR